jgi:hypothetical protein
MADVKERLFDIFDPIPVRLLACQIGKQHHQLALFGSVPREVSLCDRLAVKRGLQVVRTEELRDAASACTSHSSPEKDST